MRHNYIVAIIFMQQDKDVATKKAATLTEREKRLGLIAMGHAMGPVAIHLVKGTRLKSSGMKVENLVRTVHDITIFRHKVSPAQENRTCGRICAVAARLW